MNQVNRVVVVCGGSSGMGNAAVQLLSRDGFKVYVLDVKETKDAAYVPCDVSRYEQVRQAVREVMERGWRRGGFCLCDQRRGMKR